MGLLCYERVMRRDYPVVLGTLYLFTLIGLFTKLISDRWYGCVDPRVKFDCPHDDGTDPEHASYRSALGLSIRSSVAALSSPSIGVHQPGVVLHLVHDQPHGRAGVQRQAAGGSV